MKSRHIVIGAIKIATLVAGFAISSIGNAGQFGVRVVDDAGQPVSGAAVCFGLPGSYRQFGAQFTDADGQAIAEVPNIPFVVTVSKTRFSGVRLSEPARYFNLIKQVKLSEGIPGPRCKAGSTMADADQSAIRIVQVDVLTVGDIVSLKPIVEGDPTEYRLSLTQDISSVKWESLGTSIRLSSSESRQETIYLQLRRYDSMKGGWVEAKSRSVMVHLPASAPSL